MGHPRVPILGWVPASEGINCKHHGSCLRHAHHTTSRNGRRTTMSHSCFSFTLSRFRSRCQTDWINKATNRSSHISRGIHNGVTDFSLFTLAAWAVWIQRERKIKATKEFGGHICFEAVRHHSTAAFKEFFMGGSGSAFRLFPRLHAGIFAFRHSALRHKRYPFYVQSDQLPLAYSIAQVRAMHT